MGYRPLSFLQGAAELKKGKLIAYPTEAVFGLGCDPQNAAALNTLLNIKQRASSKGLILIASTLEQITPYIDLNPISPETWTHIQSTWPGPYTWVFPASKQASSLIQGPGFTVAMRITAHPDAFALCEAFGGAIVSTSANIATQPPLKDGQAVFDQFGDQIAGVLMGDVGGADKPTTVTNAITGEVYR